jgi:hypothetical protein
VANQLRKNLTGHRQIPLAPHYIAELPLNHTERRFDLRALAVSVSGKTSWHPMLAEMAQNIFSGSSPETLRFCTTKVQGPRKKNACVLPFFCLHLCALCQSLRSLR